MKMKIKMKVVVSGRAKEVLVDLDADLDAMVRKHSAFWDFADLVVARGGYRPSLYLGGKPMVSMAELLRIDLAYDAHMGDIGDPRRVYRGDYSVIEGVPVAVAPPVEDKPAPVDDDVEGEIYRRHAEAMFGMDPGNY